MPSKGSQNTRGISDAEYLENSSECPFCHSTDITGDFVEVDGAGASQRITCNGCGAVYFDIYELTGYIPEHLSKERARYDQYGEPVPTDLVLLPQYVSLRDDEQEIVEQARWYESADGWLLASAAQLQGIGVDMFSAEEEFMGDDLPDLSVIGRVAECLKRGNNDDGWYHA